MALFHLLLRRCMAFITQHGISPSVIFPRRFTSQIYFVVDMQRGPLAILVSGAVRMLAFPVRRLQQLKPLLLPTLIKQLLAIGQTLLGGWLLFALSDGRLDSLLACFGFFHDTIKLPERLDDGGSSDKEPKDGRTSEFSPSSRSEFLS